MFHDADLCRILYQRCFGQGYRVDWTDLWGLVFPQSADSVHVGRWRSLFCMHIYNCGIKILEFSDLKFLNKVINMNYEEEKNPVFTAVIYFTMFHRKCIPRRAGIFKRDQACGFICTQGGSSWKSGLVDGSGVTNSQR